MAETSRLSTTVPIETDEALEMLASQWGVSKSLVIKKLIGRGLTVENLVQGGGEVLYRKPDGSEEILLRGGIDQLNLAHSSTQAS